jgi:hypothetical protein
VFFTAYQLDKCVFTANKLHKCVFTANKLHICVFTANKLHKCVFPSKQVTQICFSQQTSYTNVFFTANKLHKCVFHSKQLQKCDITAHNRVAQMCISLQTSYTYAVTTSNKLHKCVFHSQQITQMRFPEEISYTNANVFWEIRACIFFIICSQLYIVLVQIKFFGDFGTYGPQIFIQYCRRLPHATFGELSAAYFMLYINTSHTWAYHTHAEIGFRVTII